MPDSALGNNSPEQPSSSFHKNVKSFNRLLFIKAFLRSILQAKKSSLVIALLMCLPLITLIFQALIGEGESFQHIKETVLSDYIVNTVLLAGLVAVLVLIIGIPLAWLLASCEFSGKRFFNWALVLPLAMPAYIVAYTYTDLLDYAGPIQITLRHWFGWQNPQDYWFFDVRSTGGAAVMLALVLYPYVYLMTKASFLEQNANLTQASRMLGVSPFKSFFKISLPLAKTAIIAGCALVLMETIADFATVNYFAVSTLTTAVYDTWLGHYDLASAAKLSCLMVLGVLALLMLEHLQNRHKGTSNDAKSSVLEIKYQLKGWRNIAAVSYCVFILFVAFFIPATQLVIYAIDYLEQVWTIEILMFTKNSLTIASATALISLSIALFLNHNLRIKTNYWQSSSLKLASTGYAIPGTVLAIGVLIPLTFLDHLTNDALVSLGASPVGLIFSGSLFAIICTHVVRFTAIANKSLEASYQKISPSLDMAAKTLGASNNKLLKRIHVPLLKRSGLVAALLIFVESMKELPAALLLRPFDFQTLPTYVYQYASDEQLELASLGAIIIVFVGLVPLIFINRSIDKQ